MQETRYVMMYTGVGELAAHGDLEWERNVPAHQVTAEIRDLFLNWMESTEGMHSWEVVESVEVDIEDPEPTEDTEDTSIIEDVIDNNEVQPEDTKPLDGGVALKHRGYHEPKKLYQEENSLEEV